MAETFKEIRELAQHLQMSNTERNTVFDAMEDAYWMRWAGEKNVKRNTPDVKLTKSPRTRNAVKGATHLLTAAEPEITVPTQQNDADVNQMASQIEKWAKATWFAAGRIRGNPIHFDMTLSAMIYGEVHLSIFSTRDLLDKAEQEDMSPGEINRFKHINKQTPYIYEVHNPKNGYPEYDMFGMRTFHQNYTRTARDIIGEWGDAARRVIQQHDQSELTSKHSYSSLFTLENRYVWIDGVEEPIYKGKHGLPFIPFVATRIDGSTIFNEEDERREPFLWTVVESGLPERQNLILTVLFTLAHSLGANPMFLAKVMDPNRPVEIEHKAGGILKLAPNEDLRPLHKDLIDPSLVQAWQTAIDLEMESTIYRQTLGAPVTGETYSGTALLHQAGRLPLVMPQRKLSWAIGEALTKSLLWAKFLGGNTSAVFEDQYATLAAAEIPENIQIKAEMDISMPHDTQAAANAAVMLTSGQKPIVSRKYALEHLLKVGQPDDMIREIWDEEATDLFFRRWSLQQLAEIGQLEQQVLQPAQAGGMPGAPGMSAPMGGEGMTIPPDMGSPPAMGGQPPMTPEGFPYAEPMPPINQGPSPEDIE